jgi:hypothetical protein
VYLYAVQVLKGIVAMEFLKVFVGELPRKQWC